ISWGERGKQPADLAVRYRGVSHRPLGVDAVVIAAAYPLAFDVPLGLEIRKHTMRLTLRETGLLSDLAHGRLRFTSNLHENGPMRGDELPFRIFWHAPSVARHAARG